ncbi:hypothetical protein ACQP2P_34005 [Dactylosporangium sp. CA-139114]|uniref:hypothetical protein n=1 Tax=Dactylosporangium sp. CA-139114 TaxID=3239931 RepID=UPI003D992C70
MTVSGTARRGGFFSQYREAVVGFVIAVGAEAANYFYFNHSPAGSQLALIVAIVGLLLAILRFALQQAISEELQPVRKLAEIVDLQAESNVDLVDGLLQRYLSVTEIEFRAVKEQIVIDATEKLRRIAVEKRSDSLQTTDYYEWLFRQFDALRPGQYAHAVSLSSDEEWNDSQLEKNFLAKNLEAAGRGATVARIFIVEEHRLAKFIQLPPIKAHTVEAATGLSGYYISRDYLERADRGVLTDIGEGFIEFNGQVGLEDLFDPEGRARGQVTMLRSDLDKMRRIYLRLMNLATPLTLQPSVEPARPIAPDTDR